MEGIKKKYSIRCEAYSKGVRCSRSVDILKTCKYHALPVKPSNRTIECEICTDKVSMDGMKWFSCDHGMCLDCITKLNSCTCPFCRSDIVDKLSAREVLAIKRNMKDKQVEETTENERYARVLQDQQEIEVLQHQADIIENLAGARMLELLLQFGVDLGGVGARIFADPDEDPYPRIFDHPQRNRRGRRPPY